MVYGIIGMINFAHGEVYMVSAYLCAIGLALLAYAVHPGDDNRKHQRAENKQRERVNTEVGQQRQPDSMSLILQNYVQLSQGPNQQGIPTLMHGVLRLTVGDGVVQIADKQCVRWPSRTPR
jgi:branched-chain amino acid transport system permease protein